jgi:hypothetical protein
MVLLDEALERFLQRVSAETGISFEELVRICTPGYAADSSTEMQSFRTRLKADLLVECKARGLSTKGTKQDLLRRLSGKKDLYTRLLDTRPVLLVHKNSWGQYEHRETGFVFDREGDYVIGRRDRGSCSSAMRPLCGKDIETCITYGLRYRVPPDLRDDNIDQDTAEDAGRNMEQEEEYFLELLGESSEDSEDDERGGGESTTLLNLGDDSSSEIGSGDDGYLEDE